MTITFTLTNGQVIYVPNSVISSSNTITSLIFDTGFTDVTIKVPDAYTSVFDIYLNFLNDKQIIINDIDTLLLCFDMESFFADNEFFKYLISQCYPLWREFYPHINTLPDDRSVYLYSPYEFVPSKYMDKDSFFDEWLDINQNKQVVLNYKPSTMLSSPSYSHLSLPSQSTYRNNGENYNTDVVYYDDNNNINRSVKTHEQIKSLHTYHTIGDNMFGKELQMKWYSNGQLEYIYHFTNEVGDIFKDIH